MRGHGAPAEGGERARARPGVLQPRFLTQPQSQPCSPPHPPASGAGRLAGTRTGICCCYRQRRGLGWSRPDWFGVQIRCHRWHARPRHIPGRGGARLLPRSVSYLQASRPPARPFGDHARSPFLRLWKFSFSLLEATVWVMRGLGCQLSGEGRHRARTTKDESLRSATRDTHTPPLQPLSSSNTLVTFRF